MDGDQLELAQRRLEDQVKAKVETDLFRYYRNLGSVVVLVLGAFGFSIGWPTVKREIENQITTLVSEPVKEAIAATQKARHTANEAQRLADNVLGRIDERQKQLQKDIGRINARYDEVSINYGSAKTRLDEINSEVSLLEEAIAYFRELAKRDPVGREELENLKSSIAEVAVRARDLASIVGESESSGPDPAVEDVQEGLARVATDQNEALAALENATIVDPRGSSTVFVQFAGGRRDDLRAVTDILRNEGWNVAPEERIASAAGKSEIRYFHDIDNKAANSLRDDLNAALDIAGFARMEITDIGKPMKVAKPPAKGILEVWLELPLK